MKREYFSKLKTFKNRNNIDVTWSRDRSRVFFFLTRRDRDVRF